MQPRPLRDRKKSRNQELLTLVIAPTPTALSIRVKPAKPVPPFQGLPPALPIDLERVENTLQAPQTSLEQDRESIATSAIKTLKMTVLDKPSENAKTLIMEDTPKGESNTFGCSVPGERSVRPIEVLIRAEQNGYKHGQAS